MRGEHDYLWTCFQWLVYALWTSCLLHLIRLSVSRFRRHEKNLTCFLEVSKNLVPTELSEEWIIRYSPLQLIFLARVVRFPRSENALGLDAHLLDDNWKLEGDSFVNSVLQWLLHDEAQPLLTGIEALVFVGGEQKIPSEVVTFVLERVFLHHDQFVDLVQAYTFVRSIQEHLKKLGLLHEVEGEDAYYLSLLVHHRPVKILEWHKGLVFDLKYSHPSYSSRHFIRLLVQMRLHQDAIETLESPDFCESRAKFLKRQAAQHHVNDCWLILKSMQDAMLPSCSLERACVQMSNQVQDGASFLTLGQFLHQQIQPLASLRLLNASIKETVKAMETDLLLLAKSFKRVSTVYLCYGLEDEYQQYKEAHSALLSCNNKSNKNTEGVSGCVLDAVAMHDRLEGKRKIASSGLEYQVARIDARLEELAKSHLSILLSANRLLGNSVRAAVLNRIIKLISTPRLRCIRDNCDKNKRKNHGSSKEKNKYWANVRNQVGMNISWK